MSGIYTVDPDKMSDFILKRLVAFCKMIGIIYLFFVVFTLHRQEENCFEALFWMTLTLCLVVFLAWILMMLIDPFKDTCIEIKKDCIIRRGEGVSTVEIAFADIGKIVEKPYGTIVIDKSLTGQISYYTDSRILTSNEHVLFIPSMMHQYTDLVQYVNRIKKP